MLGKEQVEKLIKTGGTAVITAKYGNVELKGLAKIDSVFNKEIKLRAIFGHGIKAILTLDEYFSAWTADPAEEWEPEETGQPENEPEKKISPNCIAVQRWRIENPNGSKNRCVIECGLSRGTVIRYWDEDRSIGKMEMPEN